MIPYHLITLVNPLDSAGPRKVYAKGVMVENLSSDKFLKEIVSYSRTYSRGLVRGVLADTTDCLAEHLTNGDRVTLDGLGTFSISLKSEGTLSEALFSNKNIKKANIVFTPCNELKEKLARAGFKKVYGR